MPHSKHTHATYHVLVLTHMARTRAPTCDTAHGEATELRESCARRFVRAKKDHAKMTHAKVAPVKRDLGAKQAHAKSQSAVLSWLWCA